MNVRGVQARRQEWLRQRRMLSALERGLKVKISREMKHTGRIAQIQYEHSHNVDIQTGHRDRLIKLASPYVAASIRLFADQTRSALSGKAAIDPTEEGMELWSRDYINKYLKSHLTDVSKTTANRIAKAITEGTADDKELSEIVQDIMEASGGEIGEARAETIAVTELHGASMAASLEVASGMGIPGLQKNWLTVGDDRVRPDHAEAEGQTVPLEEPFVVGGEELDMPGDPDADPSETVNCRCAVTYQVGG